jgi:hypothetical protein
LKSIVNSTLYSIKNKRNILKYRNKARDYNKHKTDPKTQIKKRTMFFENLRLSTYIYLYLNIIRKYINVKFHERTINGDVNHVDGFDLPIEIIRKAS